MKLDYNKILERTNELYSEADCQLIFKMSRQEFAENRGRPYMVTGIKSKQVKAAILAIVEAINAQAS